MVDAKHTAGLLPCPFCGKTPEIMRFAFGGAPRRGVRCCIADTGRQLSDEDAAAVWNRRPKRLPALTPEQRAFDALATSTDTTGEQ